MTHGKEKHSARWLLERWGGDERQRDVMKSDPLRDHRFSDQLAINKLKAYHSI